MGEKKIFEGKTSNEAIEKALKELKVTRKDINVKILEDEDKKNFFSILAPRIVKVEIEIKGNNEKIEVKREEKIVSKENLFKAREKLENFIKEFISKIDENIEYDIKEENGNTIYVNIKGEEAKFLIGYRGEVLNALQTIFVAVAGKNIEEKIHVNVDILGYREKRRKVLEDLAQRVAKTVITRKKSVTLEPMTAFERKIIHTKLQENIKVKTESIGEGENRRIVISLK